MSATCPMNPEDTKGDDAMTTPAPSYFKKNPQAPRMAQPCRYCGAEFVPPTPDTTYCQKCYYQGRPHAEAHAALIQEIDQIGAVVAVGIHHTGGGCFGLGVDLEDGRYLFGTVASRNAKGEWEPDATLPKPGESWTIGVYASREAYEHDAMPELRFPLSDLGVIATIRMEATS
jgi:hypothetical protein